MPKYTLIFDTKLFEEREVDAENLDAAIEKGRAMVYDPLEDLEEYQLVGADWTTEDGEPAELRF